MKSTEKTLFFSMWVMIILGFAIWRFWPGAIPPPGRAEVTVTLRPELASWFTTAKVISSTPSQYRVELGLVPDLQDRIDAEGREVHIGYHLLNEVKELSRGAVSFRIVRGPPRVEVVLPNPERVAAREIELSLAH